MCREKRRNRPQRITRSLLKLHSGLNMPTKNAFFLNIEKFSYYYRPGDMGFSVTPKIFLFEGCQISDLE